MELEFGLWRIVYARVQKFADAVRGDAETAAIEKPPVRWNQNTVNSSIMYE